MTGLFTHGIWLSLILSHASVYCSKLPSVPYSGMRLTEGKDLLNDIWADWCLENGRQWMSRPAGSTIMRSNGDRRTCRHRCRGG